MSKKIKLLKNYYEENFDLFKKSTILIQPGVTVLVGCNGIGKTTLLHQLRDKFNQDDTPYILFDNLHDGGSKSISEAGFYGDLSFMTTAMCSSEGENIILNIENLAARLGVFVKTGEDPKNRQHKKLIASFAKARGEEIIESEPSKERWILLDAVDSGLSVDNIVDIKELLFKTILENNYGNKIYILISANEYEMARNEQCFDVYNGKYITFND